MTDQDLIEKLRLSKGINFFTQEPIFDEMKVAAADRIEDFRNGISFALAWASRPIPNGTFEDRFEAYEQALITIDALLNGQRAAK